MTILNDLEIQSLAHEGMIRPFYKKLVNCVIDNTDSGQPFRKLISFGLSSFGYDIRLSPNDFRVFRHVPGTIVDPKRFNPNNLEQIERCSEGGDEYFVLPGHSYGLGVAMEELTIPEDVTVLCIGKSTYARCGVIANLTPAEAGWSGHLTLEFSNSSDADCRIYAGEGVVQLLFFRGEPCQTSYDSRQGKYNYQPERVIMARV